MENWMTELPQSIKKLAIIYLAIPGSHNSMSYEINKHSKIAPDADDIVRKVNRFFPRIVRRWAKTQSANAVTQLYLGIRYFDLRICLKEKGNFYFAHGLYSCEVFSVLQEINEFLNKHPTEFIILDFQHFYKLNYEDHCIFQKKIKQIFGDKLYGKNDGSLTECSLEYAESIKKQIIIIYRYRYSLSEEFWESEFWPTPWPNTCSYKVLKNYLDETLLHRSPYTGYVSQCIITPSSRYIVARVFFSLKFCAKRINKKIESWIKSQRCGYFKFGDRACTNVFIVDFIDIKNGRFCKTVIELNRLNNTESMDELNNEVN